MYYEKFIARPIGVRVPKIGALTNSEQLRAALKNSQHLRFSGKDALNPSKSIEIDLKTKYNYAQNFPAGAPPESQKDFFQTISRRSKILVCSIRDRS